MTFLLSCLENFHERRVFLMTLRAKREVLLHAGKHIGDRFVRNLPERNVARARNANTPPSVRPDILFSSRKTFGKNPTGQPPSEIQPADSAHRCLRVPAPRRCGARLHSSRSSGSFGSFDQKKVAVKVPFPFAGEWLAGVHAPVPTTRQPSARVRRWVA